MSKGFNCECGIYHQFALYVYAHSQESLIHTCGCGRKHLIHQFEVVLIPEKKRSKKK